MAIENQTMQYIARIQTAHTESVDLGGIPQEKNQTMSVHILRKMR